MYLSKVAFVATASILCATARAQTTTDDCAAATVDITGPGTLQWDNSGATTGTEGQTEQACYAFGTTAIDNDVWAIYVAGTGGLTVISACNSAGTNADTKIAAYAGTACPAAGTAIACNDDACGLLSQISFTATAGQSYLIQLGNFPGAPPGTALVDVQENAGPPPPSGSVNAWLSAVASGTPASYVNSLLPGPMVDDIGLTNGAGGVTYEFIVHGDNGGISSGLMGARGTGVGSDGGLKFEQCCDTQAYGATEWNIADHSFNGNNTEGVDIQLVYVANPTAGTTELFVDGTSFGTIPYAPVLQGMQGIGQIHDPNGNFDVMALGLVYGVAVYEAQLSAAEIIAHRDAYFMGGLGLGSPDTMCLPLPNSTGFAAALSLFGTGNAGEVVNASVSSGPAGEFGYHISGPNPGLYFTPPGAAGIICIGGPQFRYNNVGLGHVFQFDASGVSMSVVGGGDQELPTDGSFVPVPAVMSGDSRAFQAWYRDGPTSNFSDSLIVTFN
ncbi:MAG: hypothetical protein GY711_32380 [bacterium]|nr:hypothetical protein [bacterium]